MDSLLNDKTPKKQLNEVQSMSTPKNFARFLLLSNNQSFTPSPSSLSKRVVSNPFENQHHDRLHLPMISSPSLFNMLATPQRRQFEWTIDELSSLNPVSMVPHETQFIEEHDPIREAQAQAAISSFFTEQKIGEFQTFSYQPARSLLFTSVPSPQDCSLRKQKIIMMYEDLNSTALPSGDDDNVPSEAPAVRQIKCDIGSQTSLTFPPKLPKEVEELLKRYQFVDDDNESLNSSNRSMMDLSTLRRKLFINHPESPIYFMPAESSGIHLSPPPRTPELTENCHKQALSSATSKGNDSFSTMFGELSPITTCGSSEVSNDVSMMSDFGQEKTPRRQGCKKLKKKGKNLSESFCQLQNEFNDDIFSDKENQIEATMRELKPDIREPTRLGRFDSGFSADEDSKLSAEFMQF